MAYTPNNISVYTAAFAGSIAGMGVSNRQISDNSSSSYDSLMKKAGAFAQAFDIIWAARTTSDLDSLIIRHISESIWSDRLPITSKFDDSNSYMNLCSILIALITSAENYFGNQGVTAQPSTPATVAPGGGIAAGLSPGMVLTVGANGVLSWANTSAFMPSPVDLAKSIGAQANFAGNFTFGMLFWLVKDATLTGIRIRTQFGGGGTKNIKFRVWDPGAAQLDTKTINAIASGVDLKMAFDAPIVLSGTSTLATPGRIWGVSAYYTDGSFYGPPYGTQNGFPYPAVTDGAQSIGGRGCWITPTMAFSTWVFANGDGIPSTTVAGEHYPIEPIFA